MKLFVWCVWRLNVADADYRPRSLSIAEYFRTETVERVVHRHHL